MSGAPARRAAASAAIGPGSIVGDHVLIELLGVGGFGEVWLGRRRPEAPPPEDPEEPDLVAIKIARDRAKAEALAREASFLRRLRHPAIVRTYRLRLHDAVPHLVLEHVQGEDLGRVLDARAERRMGWAAALPIVGSIAQALAAAHGRGVVHGDIKPANVLITESGEIVLTDFGLGRVLGDAPALAATLASFGSVAAPARVAGTLAYMAPECRRGEPPSPASDLYALGVLLFEMLAGRTPRGAWRPLGALGVESWPALDAFVRRLLDPMPGRRPASAADVARVLGNLCGGPDGKTGKATARRCPREDALLHRTVVGGCVLDRCRRCAGTWFDHGELEEVLREIADADHLVTYRMLAVRHPPPGGCPVCGTRLRSADVVLRRMPVGLRAEPRRIAGTFGCGGHGLWVSAAARRAIVREVARGAGADEGAAAAPAAPDEPAPAPRRELVAKLVPPPGGEPDLDWAALDRAADDAAAPRSRSDARRQRIRALAQAADRLPGLRYRRDADGGISFRHDRTHPFQLNGGLVFLGVMALVVLTVAAPTLFIPALAMPLAFLGMTVSILLVAEGSRRRDAFLSIRPSGVVSSSWTGVRSIRQLVSIVLREEPGAWGPSTISGRRAARLHFSLRWRSGGEDQIGVSDSVAGDELPQYRDAARAFCEAFADLADE